MNFPDDNKPLYPYEVATVAVNDPKNLYKRDPNLKEPWYRFANHTVAGFFYGMSFQYVRNVYLRRPRYAGIHVYLLFGGIGAGVMWAFRRYTDRTWVLRDSFYQHYIDLHPDDFPAPERRKIADIFDKWHPVRSI